MSDIEIKKTAKRKIDVALPSKTDMVFIPNRVTNAKYDYTLMQEKIFNTVLFQLQSAIKMSMNGFDYKQLEMFKEINEDRVGLTIPMNSITTPNHYADVREAAEELGKTVIRISQTNSTTGKKELRSLYLFGAIVTPAEKVRNAVIKVELSKEVSKLLVEMDMNRMGKPSNYTSFELQIVNNAKNKYTPRIYKLISSWREKGGFYMALEEFREWLQLGDKYKTYAELKRNVLMPVQKELEGKAFCWFNCAEKSFERRIGKTVVGLSFKVITPELEQAREIQVEGLKYLLRVQLRLKDVDIKRLQPVFEQITDFITYTSRIAELDRYMAENAKKIKNRTAYIISSLTKGYV